MGELMFEIPVLCLAAAIYWEARSEPLVGQLGVAFVILNRVDDERYPDSVCGVVTQGRTQKWNPKIMIRHACQFSFFCDGLDDSPKDMDAWVSAQVLASNVMEGDHRNFMEGATHYHTDYVSPKWARSESTQRIVKVGTHIFYRLEK